jgi:hypothetical protein
LVEWEGAITLSDLEVEAVEDVDGLVLNGDCQDFHGNLQQEDFRDLVQLVQLVHLPNSVMLHHPVFVVVGGIKF